MAPRSFSTDGAFATPAGSVPGVDTGTGAVDTSQTGGMSLADMVDTFGGNSAAWPSNSFNGGGSGGAGEVLPTGGGFGIPSTPAPKPNIPSPGITPQGYGSSPSSSTPGAIPSSLHSSSLPYESVGLPAMAFDDGGAMPDQNSDQGGNDLISLALSAVDSALQYGRNKFGLGGQRVTEAAPGGGYPDFRQSPDVEDRRGQSPLPGESAVMNTVGNAYSLYDRAKNAMGYGAQPDPNDQMANDAGAKDLDQTNRQQGAIPDDEEGDQ